MPPQLPQHSWRLLPVCENYVTLVRDMKRNAENQGYHFLTVSYHVLVCLKEIKQSLSQMTCLKVSKTYLTDIVFCNLLQHFYVLQYYLFYCDLIFKGETSTPRPTPQEHRTPQLIQTGYKLHQPTPLGHRLPIPSTHPRNNRKLHQPIKSPFCRRHLHETVSLVYSADKEAEQIIS